MSWNGPLALFTAWLLHDVEEAIAFPITCDQLADRTGIEQFRMTPRQSWVAVGLMGALVAYACARGSRSNGKSVLYRAVVAGLEAHVLTHLCSSAVQRGYTAGVVTAVPVMLPGAIFARLELRRQRRDLQFQDTLNGIVLLVPAAMLCQLIARGSDAGSRRIKVIAHDECD